MKGKLCRTGKEQIDMANTGVQALIVDQTISMVGQADVYEE